MPKAFLAARILRFSLLLSAPILTSCTEAAFISSKYSNLVARFSFSPVTSAPPLLAACTSPGEWTTIRSVNQQFIFENPATSLSVNKTALTAYQSYICLSGFIVGTPTIPEMGDDVATLSAYDLACSNCYHDRNVTKRLTLQQAGRAHCTSCLRTYDLNNIGQVCQGEPGINLYRYRVYYGNNTLSISNR